MSADFSRLSLFTRNHADHEPEWTLQGPRTDSLVCIPCIVEMLEDSEELVVRKRFVLGELLQMMGASENRILLDMLSENQRLAWHIVETLHELLGVHREDSTITDVIVELLVQLCCQLECEELVCCLLHHISQQVSETSNLQHFLPSLTLLGQLVNNIPALGDRIIQTQGPLLGSLIAYLDTSDEKTKAAVVYALLKILSDTDNQVPIHLYGQMANKILALLTGAQSKDLQQNSMELLRKLLVNEDVTRGVMQHGNKSSLPSILKKMMMSRDDGLQVSSMQCVRQILLQDVARYSDDLLDADIAEFLFEALSTTDCALLSCTFGCLLLFTDCQSFFTKCHTVYGIESIVRAVHHCVKLNNTDALHEGLQVLTEILKRQPEDIHLLNGLGIHKQINSLLKTCLKHTDITVQIQAAQAMRYLISKHHLPSPMDDSSLLELLQGVQDCIERLPRPITKVTSRHHHRKPASHEDKTNKDGGTCSKEEELLLIGLQVFEQAFSLAGDLGNNAVPDSALVVMSVDNAKPNTSQNTHESLQYFLLRVLDATCIPVFMVNYVDLSGDAGHASFFHMLTLSLKFDINLKQFAQKLADCCFIQLAIDVKNKIANISRESAASDVINTFLLELCLILVGGHQTDKELTNILQQGLPLVKGNSEEIVSMLCHQKSPISSYKDGSSMGKDPVDIKHQAVLALLYVAFLHSDRLVSETDLEEAVDKFMSVHQDFKALPRLTVKHLLFLCAVCHCANNVQNFQEFLSTQDMLALYSHQPVMLHWCCTSLTLPYSLAKTMLEMWISDLEGCHEDADFTLEEASKDVKVTLELLKTNSNSLSMMLEVLCSSNEEVSEKASWLIKLSLNQSSTHESEMIVDILQDKLPGVMQRLFLEEKHKLQDVHCIGVLDLLCGVHINCAIPGMEPISAKLAYHVTNLLSKESSSNPELVRVSLNYLTCLMVQTDKQSGSRVALVVLSSVGVLQMLEDIVQNPDVQMTTLQGCALSLLAQLVEVQRKTNIKVKHQVTLDLTSALNMVQRSRDNFIRVCATQFMESLLAAEFQSTVVKLEEMRDGGLLVADEDVGLVIRSCHVRRLMIILQNNMLKGDDTLCQASVACLHALITYAARKSPDLGRHLLSQPWNQLLVNQCLDLNDKEIMLATLLKLGNMFVNEGAVINQATVDALSESVIKCAQKKCIQVTTWDQYVEFVNKILEQPNLRITSRLRDKISDEMTTTQEHEESRPDIFFLQGVVVASLSFCESIQDTRSIANKIHVQLTSAI